MNEPAVELSSGDGSSPLTRGGEDSSAAVVLCDLGRRGVLVCIGASRNGVYEER